MFMVITKCQYNTTTFIHYEIQIKVTFAQLLTHWNRNLSPRPPELMMLLPNDKKQCFRYLKH